MKCLRCGYCCIRIEVIIVNNPVLGIVDDNLMAKHTGQSCPHLTGKVSGEYSCAIHDEDWYKDTPCFSHTQIGLDSAVCRTGKFLLENSFDPAKMGA